MSDKPQKGYVATGVWRVKGHSGNVVYLAGTCHEVSDKERPFPSTYYAAYQDSQDIFLEIDADSFATKAMMIVGVPSGIGFMLKHDHELNNSEGRKLSDSLSPQTVKLLRKRYGSRYNEMEKHTPLGLLFHASLMGDFSTDTATTDQSQGSRSPQGVAASSEKNMRSNGGVDDYFNFLAHRDHKKTRALDRISVARSITPVMSLTLEDCRKYIASQGADAAVREALLPPTTTSSAEVTDWRSGKMEQSLREMEGMKKDHPEIYRMLLPDRNSQWMPTIVKALEGKRKTMVLVGALHLPGKDGLLEMLRHKGYKPEQLYGVDRPKVARMQRQ